MSTTQSTAPASPPPYESRQPHPSGVSDGNYPSLPETLVQELRDSVLGKVFTRTDRDFRLHTTIFNGNVVTPAKAVATPTSTADVSSIMKFCTKHSLYPSIKAGGYGTAGWAINGDIVVDLRKLNGIHIEPPLPGGGKAFTSLRDTPVLGTNGKGKARANSPTADHMDVTPDKTDGDVNDSDGKIFTGKRRRSTESLPSFDSGQNELPRDPLVAKFLHASGPDLPSPAVRRRLDNVDHAPASNTDTWTSTPKVDLEYMQTDGKEHHGGSTQLDTISSPQLSSQGESGKVIRASSNDGSISTSTSASTMLSASNSTSASTTLTDPSTAPTSPRTVSNDSEKCEEASTEVQGEEETLGFISSIPAGMHNQSALMAYLQQRQSGEGLDFAVLTPQAFEEPAPPLSRTPSFNIRTEDPFGYLSAPPSAPAPVSGLRSGVHPPRGYEQPAFDVGSLGPDVGRAGPSNVSLLPDAVNTASISRSTFLSDAMYPVHPHAYVSFGAGERQKDIDIFTAEHPLPAASPSGNVGEVAYHIPLAAHPVGSSVMLLGGFGFLSRLHGLSIDALVEVEMVLADGTIVYVSEEEHPDLWWALRGAGPVFGVVTGYKAKAYPVPVVFAGNLIYNFHASTAASLIKHFRDCVKSAPRELYANVLLTAGPADKGSLVVVQLCYIGNKEKGRKFLEAIASWDGEPCLLNEVSEKSFLAQQDSVAQILRGKAGRQWFIRSALITSLPDEIIHKTVNEFADTPVGCTWLFELAGGAVGDADDTCFPKAQREAGFTIAAFHQWELDDDDPLCVTTAEHWIEETLAPVSTGGPNPAFLGRHESASRVIGCFGSNWERLVELKRKYDPNGLFRHNFWPLDVEGRVSEPCEREPKSPIMRPRVV